MAKHQMIMVYSSSSCDEVNKLLNDDWMIIESMVIDDGVIFHLVK